MSKSKKIAITGADGLLGKELVSYFSAQNNIIAVPLTHTDIEISDPESVNTAIKKHSPDIIINCAVILDIDFCEKNPNKCYNVNRDGVKHIIEAVKNSSSNPLFAQISSSEVFGRVNEGEYKIKGYSETDEPKPVSAYQKSKKEAEDIALKYENSLVVRSGWFYGKGRQTFVENFLKKLQGTEPIKIIKDQWRSPTWTKDFAQGLEELIFGKYEKGIYHIVSEVKENEATTMDVIEEIKKHLKEKCANPEIELVSRLEFFKTPRAPSNVILNTKLPKLPYWRVSLQEYLKKYYPL